MLPVEETCNILYDHTDSRVSSLIPDMQKPVSLFCDFRFMFRTPAQFGSYKIGVRPVPGAVYDFGESELLRDFVRFHARPPIHPDECWAKRRASFVDGQKGGSLVTDKTRMEYLKLKIEILSKKSHVLANAATYINDLRSAVAAFARTWGYFTGIKTRA